MIRELLRAIGIGCIVAGGILYFTGEYQAETNAVEQAMQADIEKLQIELAKAKEELAIAQTASSVNTKETVQKENKHREVSSVSEKIIQQVLTIESGTNSTVVAAALESAGIIDDAGAFDAYLTNNGLSGKIQIGESFSRFHNGLPGTRKKNYDHQIKTASKKTYAFFDAVFYLFSSVSATFLIGCVTSDVFSS